MKFQRFHIESNMQPFEVEEDEWVMEPSPERFGIRIVGADNSLDSKDAMRKVKDWCDSRDVYNISNLIYFDTEAQRLEFEMVWL
jgi:hypothetical protein